MICPVYSIKDELVGFGSPIVEQNEATALRNFTYAMNRPDSLANENKKDYTLYKIAEYDTEKGCIKAVGPEFIVNGSAV